MPRSYPRLRSADGKRNEIGVRLKARRKALKLTQENLCAQLAVVTEGAWIADLQEISRIESGSRIVADVEILALARALKCNPCYLLTGESGATETIKEQD